MNGPVSAEDVEALIRFYRDRGTEARILVSPYADPSLFEQLGERGFRLVDLDTVLVRRVDPARLLSRHACRRRRAAGCDRGRGGVGEHLARRLRASRAGAGTSTMRPSSRLPSTIPASPSSSRLRPAFSPAPPASTSTGPPRSSSRTAPCPPSADAACRPPSSLPVSPAHAMPAATSPSPPPLREASRSAATSARASNPRAPRRSSSRPDRPLRRGWGPLTRAKAPASPGPTSPVDAAENRR